MHFDLTDEQKAVKELATKYAVETIAPIQETDEAEGRFRPEIVKEMAELGFWGTLITEEYGGSEAGFLTSVLIVEAISKVSPAYAGHLLTQTAGTGWPILNYGTEKQKNKYLSKLVTAELLGCFATTEPDSGSDVISMRMTADEEQDAFILNGAKTWITNAPVADLGMIFAYTDKEKKHQGISCFIVDLKKDSSIEIRPIEKLGQRCVTVGEIIFTDTRVPKDSLLGQKGDGFKILMALLNNTRLLAAARALGLLKTCLEKSIEYARTRVQFGRPIGKFQMIQDQIAEIYINYEASKTMVYQAASNKDKGSTDVMEVSAAKYLACESAVKATNSAMRIYGAYGFSMEYPIQRYLRDSFGFIITEGSSNIQKVIIAKNLLNF